ncbi:MAG TPA: zf-HC2 domain-containing protein [Terriglobales bacterium]|nr:zf-HC2 domain-containing protein [Terriglobales bacterium]
MPEVPKIVHHRLRAEATDLPHPEADLLAAFAEQALTPAERESVLQHLALCADCRDVVALGLPAMEVAARSVEDHEQEKETVAVAAGYKIREPRARFSWANLRWATLAAGIAVALLVLRPALDHRQTAHQPAPSIQHPAPTSEAKLTASPAQPAAPAEIDRGASPNAHPSSGTLQSSKTKDLNAIARANDETRGGSHFQAGRQLASNVRVTNGLPGAESSESKKDLPSANVPAANETVNVEAATGGLQISTESGPIAQAEVEAEPSALRPSPAIEKAKPALDDQAGNQNQKYTAERAPAAMVSGQAGDSRMKRRDEAMPAVAGALVKQATLWTITNGALERSLDGGRTWNKMAGADSSLLCYASHGQEVWAGGQGGKLLHSADNAATFSAVAVSAKGQPLTSAITQIELTPSGQLTLTTGNHETWFSADNGKTWETK